MIDAAGYARSEKYRALFPFYPEDQPLVVQVELNVGCPQRCAKKGGYGAFLMDRRQPHPSTIGVFSALGARPEHLEECVRAMAAAIRGANPRCACLVKIRCFENNAATVRFARMLVRAGCQCLTVHGRTRHQGGGVRTGKWLANWGWIKGVRQGVPIPVISNGNIRFHSDLGHCLAETGCAGVMSGCGALRRPTLFAPNGPGHRLTGAVLALEVERNAVGNDRESENSANLDETRDDEKGDLPRVQAALQYIPLAERYAAHPRAVAKHLTAMLPARVARGGIAAEHMVGLVHELARSTRGNCTSQELGALAAAAEKVWQESVKREAEEGAEVSLEGDSEGSDNEGE